MKNSWVDTVDGLPPSLTVRLCPRHRSPVIRGSPARVLPHAAGTTAYVRPACAPMSRMTSASVNFGGMAYWLARYTCYCMAPHQPAAPSMNWK